MTVFNLTKVVRLLEKANDQKINVSFINDELSVQVQKGKQIDKVLLDELRLNKPFLIHYFKNFANKNHKADLIPIQKIDRKQVKKIPLSFAQERLWFIHQLEGSVQYHLPTVLRLKGNFSVEILEQILQTIVNRHEPLRTVILEEDGRGYQCIKDENEWRLEVMDGSVYKEDNEGLQHFIRQLISEPFNLSQDSMLRAVLIGLGIDEHILVITMHHIASDAWSKSVLVKEVVELYSASVEGRQHNLPPIDIQYADYASDQRSYLQDDVLNKKLDYWTNKLDGVETLQLPSDYVRPAVPTSNGDKMYFSINKETTEQLHRLSQKNGATLFMTLLAIYKLMLSRYSGQQDICVGTSFARRERPELEGLIGFFVNTLALRDEINPDLTFTELLQQVKATTLGAFENQDIPFEKIVETVVKERNPGKNPLFQVMLVLANTGEVSALKLGTVELSAESYEANTAKFEITFFISEGADGLQGSVAYSTDLYKSVTIKRMATHFESLVSSVVKNPQQKIALLSMITDSEEQQLLQQFNSIAVAYSKDKSIIDLFEEQVSKSGDSIALVFEDEEITYNELNERSNQLAHCLISRGVKAGSLVPLYIERSAAMMIGIIGIMKAGAAYVPIDTDFPQERINHMLEDAGAKIIVSNTNSIGNLEVENGVEIIEIENLASQSKENLTAKPLHDDLAYVIYTSGSTGKPKGVMIEHRNLADYYYGLKESIQIDQCRSFALVSTIATDLGNTVIYASLLSGGALHVFSKESVSNIEYLHKYFSEHTIDCLKIVPSHWKALSSPEELFLPKQLLVFGGEALQRKLIEDINSSGTRCRVINHYGPTETTIGKLLHEVNNREQYNTTIPIGKPFSNTKAYVLSREMQLCPVGIPGQLYIAGDGVARGYYNNAELSKEKFITDPFMQQDGSKMYGTGDLVKWLPDGIIEFIGRVDDQVKIRGYRIELGEIETVLQMSELVSQAVVLAREDKQGNKRLIGYIVPEGAFEKEGILNYLKDKLPDFMIPSVLLELESLPLTANGKVSRKSLPDPEADELLSGVYVAPRNEAEATMADIWQDVLEVEQVGIHDDFFELGGHSLLAVRLVSAIRKAFAIEMPIGEIFDYPTVALLSTRVGNQSDAPVLPSIEVLAERPAKIPLSFSQERLWFIDQLEGSTQYHIPSVLRFKGKLNVDAIIYALRGIIHRHEVLRTTIHVEDGTGYQFIKEVEGWKLQLTDGWHYQGDAEELKAHIQQLINNPFDLSKDYMLRGHLIRMTEEDHVLVIILHHIASDGWSTSVIVKELLELYKSLTENIESSLLPLPVQFADFALWQRNYLQGDVLEKKLGYWKQKLEAVEPLQLPTDYSRPAIQSTNGAIVGFKIGKDLTGKLLDLGQQNGTTLFMTCLAAFKVFLYRYSGQPDICVGIPTAGRDQQELEGMIGFFINTLVLRNEVNGSTSFTNLLQQVRVNTLETFEHQSVPFEKVVDAVVKEREMSRSPLFQVMFVFQNTPKVEDLRIAGIEISREEIAHDKSKFELTFNFTETANGMDCAVVYCTDLYIEETILRMIGHFQELLWSIVKSPIQTLDSLPMMQKAEQSRLLSELNDKTVGYPKDKTIIHLFEEQVLQSPGNTALIFEQQHYTYKELNERSNQLAHYLQAKGVGLETLVPICIERSLDMMVGLLAILKAGGVYVPVDPDYPLDRIMYVLEDTAASVIVSSKDSRPNLPMIDGVDVIEIDGDWVTISQQPGINLALEISPRNLAYVIYTSGSTGKPKGVMIEHYNVVRLFKTDAPLFDFSEKDVWTMFHSFCFDFSVWEMYGALFYGGRLVIVPKEVTKDASLFADLLVSEKITVLNQVPSAFYVLQESVVEQSNPASVRYVIFGGEALDPAKLRPWKDLNPACKLINMYGITETTVHVTYQEIEWQHIFVGNSIIGKPIPTLSLHILDKHQHLLPIGIAGELCVGGAGLARGYLNRIELTAERFIKDPFSNEPGARLYRSGDLGIRLNDGNIQYLGRIDEQVKIRGYRIELGEIEMVLNDCKSVRQAIVLAKGDKQNNKWLVAYIVPDGDFNREELITYLKGKLPEYMAPSMWVAMESFPLTSSGKIHRKALPDPDASSLISNEFVAPVTEMELTIAGIWKEVLNVDRVGMNDNFFELGGDSIKVIRVVHKLRNLLNKEIKVFDIYHSGTLSALMSFIEKNTEQHSSSDEVVRATEDEIDLLKNTVLPLLPGADQVEDVYPMSDIQSGMVFASLVNPELAMYHDQFVYILSEKIDGELFEKSLGLLVNKHSILRTAFNMDVHAEGVQVVYKTIPIKVDSHDLQNETEQDARIFIKEYMRKERANPFEISIAPLWRAGLFYLHNQTIFLFQFHHAILDGWSVASFSTELNNLYLKLLNNPQQEALPPLMCTYKDYIIESIAEKKNDENREFWLNEMEDYKRLDIFSRESTFQKVNKVYDQSFLELLNKKTKKDGLSVKGLLLGAYLYALNMLTFEDELTVGLVTNNRPVKEDSDKLLGCFLNTIPFRFKPGQQSLTWESYFEQVENKMRDLKQRDRTTLLDIVKITGEKVPNENPFFDVIFNFTNFHIYENADKGLSEFEQVAANTNAEAKTDQGLGYELTNTHLNCTIRLTGNVLGIGFLLSKNLSSGNTLEDLASWFDKVINCYIENYEEKITSGNIIPAGEVDKLLREFNNTEVDFPANKTLVDLFEEQIAKTPDAIAVVFEDDQLSYRQLNERANQLAHYLLAKGIKAETLVPICLERSLEMIVGIWGILKAGAAYVPIDPGYPAGRISYMLTDTGAVLALSNKECSAKLPSSAVIEIIELDTAAPVLQQQKKTNPGTGIKPGHLAYVIYTSGSTGMPKGAMNEHRGIVNRLLWAQDYYKLTAADAVLQKTTFCFDVSVWELIWPSIAGAKLVFAKPGGHKDNDYLRSAIERQHITMMHFVPSMLGVFLPDIQDGDCKGLKKVLCSGEGLKPAHVAALREKLPHVELHNLYGPTEAAIDVTYWSVNENAKEGEPVNMVPIGKPVANTSIYILNKNNSLVPMGATGEIHIGGVQVGRGYLNRPELTTQKFIADPFSKNREGRMYKTGDLGCWLPDGNIEYLGRIDDQVKIRGYRIELGEIESALQQSRLVSQAVVLARENSEGTKRLIAYVVPEEGFTREAVTAYLSGRLPDYMVPQLWVELAQFPLTSNGKVDKKSLPDLDVSDLVSGEYIAPDSEFEKQLAETWQQLLGIERAGINDNFFELGGDSILTIQVVSRMRRLGFDLKPMDIFIHRTIGNLSKAIKERSSSAITGEQGVLTGSSGLLPIQQWYFEQSDADVSYFNQSVLLSIVKSVSPEVLNRAVEQLMAHHDALRFKYQNEAGHWSQEYGTNMGVLTTHDLRSAKEESFGRLVREHAEKYQASLDIEKGDIVKFVLIQTPEYQTHNRLLIVVHHLAIDGVSWRILLDDLELLLSQLQKEEGKAELGNKSSSYRQWYEALEQYGKSNRLKSQTDFWEEIAESYEPLKVDKEYPRVVRVKDIETETMRFDKVQTQLLLQEVPRVYHTEINDMILCALALTLNEWRTKDKIIIGLEGHGRESISEVIDTSRTVGWFTSFYPIMLKTDAGSGISNAIKSVKEQLRLVPDKGVGYGVLKYINKDEKLKGRDCWDIVFNYLGQLDNVVSSGKWLSGAKESKGDGSGKEHSVRYLLSLNGMVQGGELILNWSYSNQHYNKETIIELIERYQNTLQSLITHCIEQNKDGVIYTPSDYGLESVVSYEELDQFLKVKGNDNIMSF